MLTILRTAVIATILALPGAETFAAQDTPDHGWFYYQLRSTAPDQKPLPKPPETGLPRSTPSPEMLSSAWLRDNLPKYRDAAIDKPTQQNVQLYMYLQRLAMDRADRFSQATQLAVLKNPALDESQRAPLTAPQKVAAGPLKTAATTRILQKVSQEAGLWFFFRSDCPYCHKESPILEAFQRLHGIDVLPISTDGQGLADGSYPNYVTDSGQSAALGVTVTPTFFLVHRDGRVLKLAQGLQSLTEFEDRILDLGHSEGWVSDADYQAARGVDRSSLADSLSMDEDPNDPAALLRALMSAGTPGGGAISSPVEHQR